MRVHLLLCTVALTVCGCASGGRGTDRYPEGPRPDVVITGDRDDDRRDDRGPRALRNVPPGHYPPPGECRVWYAGRPPGHQPPPTRCGALVGRVPRGAFVLYNDKGWDLDYDWRAEERRQPGSVPRVILDLVAGVVRR